MLDLFTPAFIAALFQVVLIDIVLAGDNAVVIGLAAARLPSDLRRKAILIGIGAATALRIVLAAGTTYLLQIVGLIFAGGLLLLWVAWKMGWELVRQHRDGHAEAAAGDLDVDKKAGHGSFGAAVWQIVVADVSMSVDNVLAVAGAAREHPIALAFGLLLSIGLMGLAASLIARVLERFRWLGWIGLAAIIYVAVDMIWRGAPEVWDLAVRVMG